MSNKKNKAKVGAYWAASCGGCDVALLGLHERILDLLDFADIAFWPAATDFKYEDLKGYDRNEIDLTFFNGGIRTSENREIAEILREKSELLVAYGSCAHQGGIPSLANMSSQEELFDTVYKNNPTTVNPEGVVPQEMTQGEEGSLNLPGLQKRVKSLGQVVEVDYTVPGCPPPPELTEDFLDLLLADDLPPKGSVVAGEKTVCDECSREWNKETIDEFHRPQEVEIDPDKCLLDQGIICMGPVTRSGCEASCPEANLPCKGCFGPPPKVEDQGTEMLNSLASVVQIGEEGGSLEGEKALLSNLPDTIGTFYNFSLANSIFGGKVSDGGKDERK
ncbi:MAG: oxidoreductase [Candidatus Bipolaricaulota bacterium]